MQPQRFAALLLLLLIFGMTLSLAQETTPEVTPELTAEVTPVSTEPVSTAEVTPEVTESAPVSTAEVTPASTEDVTPEPTATLAEGEYEIYIVQYGDSLVRLANYYEVSVTWLAEVNNITNPALIYVGQRLRVPLAEESETTPTPPPPEMTAEPDIEPTDTVTYIVKRGDSLYTIAIRNNTTISTLVALNNLSNSNVIFVGQRLLLPAGSPDGQTSNETATAIAGLSMGRGIEVFIQAGQDVAALSSQAAEMGVDWVKITADWSLIEPQQGEYDFALLDSAITTFNDADIDVLVTLIGTPDWALPSATDFALSTPLFIPPEDLNQFGQFAGNVALRYKGQVAAYEIWSAPNIRINWLNPTSSIQTVTDAAGNTTETVDMGLAPMRYIDLLEVAYTNIKDKDPDALVITAGLAPVGYNDYFNAIDTFVFLSEMLEQGALNFSDGIGVQLDGYNNAPDAECCGEPNSEPPFDETYHFYYQNMLENYRIIVTRYGGDNMPLWVTHFGWGTAENALGAPREDLERYITYNTATEQADYTEQAFTLAAEMSYIETMILYNLNGCAVGSRNACFYSAIDVNGDTRSVSNAFAD